jgi:hypothetical protein
MNTKLVALFFAAASTLAGAQLSSPVAGAPAGTGAGVHSPNSPIAPLPARADVLPWSLLTDVKTKNVKGSISPVFNASQMALNQRVQRVQGFMMPLDPGEKHSHFLLSSVPLSCGFCTPGGPESMVEVKSRVPVRYSIEPVVVEGHFQVLVNDPFGIYYRMADASPVR